MEALAKLSDELGKSRSSQAAFRSEAAQTKGFKTASAGPGETTGSPTALSTSAKVSGEECI